MSMAIQSMIYELGLRLKNGGIFIVILLPLGLAGLFLFVAKQASPNEVFNMIVPLHALLGSMVCLSAEEMHRHYLLPLTTRRLVAVRLMIDIASAFLLTLSTSIFTMLICKQSGWPVFQVALFAAAATPLWHAVVLGFRRSPGLQFAAGLTAITVVVITVLPMFYKETRHLSPTEQMQKVRSSLIITGTLFTVVGSWITFQGVKRDRHGDGWRLPTAFGDFFLKRSEKLPPTSTSPTAALNWFQQTHSGTRYLRFVFGFFFLTAAIGITLFPGGLISMPSDAWAQTFAGIMIVEFVLFGWLGGLRCGTTENKPPGNHLQTVYANLPISDRQMADGTLLAGVKTMIPFAILITVLQIVVGVYSYSGNPHANFLVPSDENHWAAIPLQIFVVLLGGWIIFANCFWTWISGRVSLFAATLLVGVLSLYTAGLPRWIGPGGAIIRDSINASTSIGLTLLLLWIVHRTKSLNLVDQKSIRRLLVSWLAVYAFTVLTLVYTESVLELSDYYDRYWLVVALIANAVASMAVLPIPAARLAIYWNRHKA